MVKEARNRGYEYVTSYVHRLVITNRKKRGEPIEIVQKYDPDRLDYYRVDLKKLTDVTTITDQDPRIIETLPFDLGIH
jgi:hypothetical protein